MEILIKLDKRLYEYAKHHTLTSGEIDEICDVIANGVPLPKGHGRLVDADEIDNNIYDLTRGMDLNYEQISEVVDTAPTIVKADRSKEDG